MVDTVATEVVLLLHMPPPVLVLSADVVPIQIPVAPDIGAGDTATVTVVVAAQPVERVYVIVTVPGDTPPITPVVSPAVAIEVFALVQVPPPALLNVVV